MTQESSIITTRMLIQLVEVDKTNALPTVSYLQEALLETPTVINTITRYVSITETNFSNIGTGILDKDVVALSNRMVYILMELKRELQTTTNRDCIIAINKQIGDLNRITEILRIYNTTLTSNDKQLFIMTE